MPPAPSLQSLPFALTHLNLKALWLAENQAQPMLRFQTEDDAQTGEKVLTCYLLPQQPPLSLGRLLGGRDGAWPRVGRGFPLTRASAEDPGPRSSPSESWGDAPLGRVSVIQFLEAPAGDEDAEEAAAEKRVWGGGVPGGLPPPHPCLTPAPPRPSPLCPLQGLQRRATPHPSELKVMKRGVERRSEATSCRPDSTQHSPSPPPSEEVPGGTRGAWEGCPPYKLSCLGTPGWVQGSGALCGHGEPAGRGTRLQWGARGQAPTPSRRAGCFHRGLPGRRGGRVAWTCGQLQERSQKQLGPWQRGLSSGPVPCGVFLGRLRCQPL